jgi:hypothetical protein
MCLSASQACQFPTELVQCLGHGLVHYAVFVDPYAPEDGAELDREPSEVGGRARSMRLTGQRRYLIEKGACERPAPEQ